MPGKYSQLAILLLTASLFGCENSPPPESASSATSAPEMAPADPLPDSITKEISIAELRQKLNANQNAAFEKRNGQILMAKLSNSGVTDLSPLQNLPLIQLELDNLAISDLSALKGMPLKNLYLTNTKVTDLTPLAGMDFDILWLEGTPISDLTSAKDITATQFNLNGTKVSSIAPLAGKTFDTLWLPHTDVKDLSPLATIKLKSLDIENTLITDLSPLAGHDELLRLNIAGVRVSNLSPLKDLKIERLVFTPELCRESWDILKNMKSIQQIGTSLEKLQPPAQFWNDPQWEK